MPFYSTQEKRGSMSDKGESILSAIGDLGGAARMSEVANHTGLSVNTVSKILGQTEGWEKVTSQIKGLQADVLVKLTREYKESHLFWRYHRGFLYTTL